MDFTEAFDKVPSQNGKASSGLDAFDTAEAAPEYQPLPAGIYPARVVSGVFQPTKKGDDSYKVYWEVTEGELRGRRLSRTFVFTEKAIGYAKRDLAILGLTTSKQLLEPWPPLGCEIYCRLTVALQRGNDNNTFNDVKKIDAVRVVDSTAKPFLIDSDAGQSEGGKP